MNALIEPMPSRPLTKRQREVLALLTQGLSNKEIARMIGIAEATTKIHMAALIRNLGARNRTEAAFIAATTNQDDDRDAALIETRRQCLVAALGAA